jgi:hypothetical protein
MESLLAFILEGALELILELVFSLLAEVGLRCLREPFIEWELRNPIFAGIGYFLFGLGLGGLSLLVFPSPLVHSERFHGINLLITPLLVGLLMSALGRLRRRQGKSLLRLDTFAYGFIFAFAMSAVRFLVMNT